MICECSTVIRYQQFRMNTKNALQQVAVNLFIFISAICQFGKTAQKPLLI